MSRAELYRSFDARIWAKEFVAILRVNPDIAADEETMTTWFASALMRGYDQHYWESKEYKRMIRRALVPWWKRWLTPLSQFGRLMDDTLRTAALEAAHAQAHQIAFDSMQRPDTSITETAFLAGVEWRDQQQDKKGATAQESGEAT